MPANRMLGMDQDHYAWSPMPERAPLRWANGAKVAFSVVILAEYVEVVPPQGSVQVGTFPPAGTAIPDARHAIRLVTQREYGHRVGIFAMLDCLEAHGMRASVALDAMSAERYPALVDHLVQRDAEIVAHGISVSRVITNTMPQDEERDYVADTLRRLEATTGTKPVGWFGPEQCESERTPDILAEAGIEYTCDWPNDDQPYAMTKSNGLVSVPTAFLLDDGHAMGVRSFRPDYWADAVIRTAQTLAAEAADSARCFVLVVRPWLTGLPFRMGAFDRALATLAEDQDVWAATTGEISRAYRDAVLSSGSPDPDRSSTATRPSISG
jgi:allantoinase